MENVKSYQVKCDPGISTKIKQSDVVSYDGGQEKLCYSRLVTVFREFESVSFNGILDYMCNVEVFENVRGTNVICIEMICPQL